MIWNTLLDPAFSGHLCLTLMHSLWQVTLLALLVWCIDGFGKNASVERRYTLHVAALLVAIIALPVTYQLLDSNATEALVSNRSQATSPTVKPATRTLNVPPVYPEQVRFKQAPRQSESHQPAIDKAVATKTPTIDTEPVSASFELPWISLAPWIAVCYALGVGVMLVRLILASLRANRLGHHAQRIEDSPLVTTLNALAQQWSMKIVPALARAEEIVIPKVIGVLRPTILLPTSALSGLSPAELELILAHELAHVRRYDMWIYLLQRFAESVLFFNPLLWYLSRRISVLREFCCDEMACQSASSPASTFESRVEYATALLRIAELAQRHSPTKPDLTSLAASGKSPSEIRRRIARLFGEPLREPLPVSHTGLLALIALACALPLASLVSASPAETPAKAVQKTETPTPDKKTNPAKAKTSEVRTFRLNVVDPDGTPVPHALIEARTDPAVKSDQIERGSYVRKSTYGPFVKTDEQGVLQIQLPERLKRFNLSIEQPGFGPYWASWSLVPHRDPILAEFTAQLDKAWTVGATIVDQNGKPIADATVKPSLEFKKRPGHNSQLGVGTRITTDAKGQWSYPHIPDSQAEIHFEVTHPDYSPWRGRLSRTEYSVKKNASPSGQIVLNQGLTIVGVVTDEQGNPIPDALVRTKFMNALRKTTTDENGVYILSGCEPKMARVVVSAKGRAMELKDVRVAADLEPVDFILKPGGKIRIRVIDEQGKGVPKSRIFFQRWRGQNEFFEFDHVNQYADENGVWEWNEAPLDEFVADICRTGGMQLTDQKLIAREKEYLFSPPQTLVISGKVIDAKTKKPIKQFHVTHGRPLEKTQTRVFWNTTEGFESRDGKYELRINRDDPFNQVRIEADGYRVAVSREIKPYEGNVTFDFALEPAQEITARIQTPAGKPASDAEISIGIAGTQIAILNGKVRDLSTYATRVHADAEGQFEIPSREEPFQLVITHPEGFAYLASENGKIPDSIQLTAWARLEGTFRVDQKIAPQATLSIMGNGINVHSDEEPSIYTQNIVQTDQNGRFVFERVFPGSGFIGREMSFVVNQGAPEVTSSVYYPLQFEAGKTIKLDLGRTGRAVIGKLVPPDSFQGKVIWQFASLRAHRYLKPPAILSVMQQLPNDPVKYQAWLDIWKDSPNYKQDQAEIEEFQRATKKLLAGTPYLQATLNREGTFRIDDAPPGTYSLSVHFYGSDNNPGPLIDYIFTVPPVEQEEEAKSVDLGTLTLK